MWPGHSHRVCVYKGLYLLSCSAFTFSELIIITDHRVPHFHFAPSLAVYMANPCHHPTPSRLPCIRNHSWACCFQKFSVYVSMEALGFTLIKKDYSIHILLSLPPPVSMVIFPLSNSTSGIRTHFLLMAPRAFSMLLAGWFVNFWLCSTVKMCNTSLLCIE